MILLFKDVGSEQYFIMATKSILLSQKRNDKYFKLLESWLIYRNICKPIAIISVICQIDQYCKYKQKKRNILWILLLISTKKLKLVKHKIILTSGMSSGTLPIHDKDRIVQSHFVFEFLSKCKCMFNAVQSKKNNCTTLLYF